MAYLARYDRILKPEGDEFRPGARPSAPPAGVASPPPPSGAAPVASPQAAGASGFVSFDQRLAANQSGAEGMANKVATDTRKAADKTVSSLGGLQGSFSEQLQAGSLAGPNGVSGPKPTTSQLGTSASNPATPTTTAAAQGQVPAGQPSGAGAPPPVAGAPAAPATARPSPYARILDPGASVSVAPSAASGRSTLYGGPQLRGQQTQLAGSIVPVQATGTDRDRAHFQYTGPDDLRSMGGFADIEASALDADSRLAATGDNAGRQALLEQSYGGSRTAGGGALDAALTGAAGGERFAQLRKRYGPGLGKMVSEADAAARGQADAAKKSTADAAAAYGKRADASDAERKAVADAEAAAQIVPRNDAARVRAGELYADQEAAALAERRGTRDSTRTMGDEKAAIYDGVWEEWLKAGSPPYAEWKRSRGG